MGKMERKESIGHLHPVAEVFEEGKEIHPPKQEFLPKPILIHGEYLSRSTPRKTKQQNQEEISRLEKAVQQPIPRGIHTTLRRKDSSTLLHPSSFYTCS